MAKQAQENEKKIEVKEFNEIPKPQATLPALRRGEVLVAEVDDNGKEINYFVSNQKTFDDFYSKNKKFKLKKK
ncbi:hypothetical protein EGI16_03435 [Chryseobacterium sp. G0240]|uniref:hypothetical protein n=1 Tax=Chryseobacterium sp. G0240 TaxID=2487066 RepID=UPI000F459A22|nr:hypothetical protein [Chryseobacterium sp. G0240]ROI05452.1 hypothetical protein EGI16_03435 [Chryseobacterium sp. G0240]